MCSDAYRPTATGRSIQSLTCGPKPSVSAFFALPGFVRPEKPSPRESNIADAEAVETFRLCRPSRSSFRLLARNDRVHSSLPRWIWWFWLLLCNGIGSSAERNCVGFFLASSAAAAGQRASPFSRQISVLKLAFRSLHGDKRLCPVYRGLSRMVLACVGDTG